MREIEQLRSEIDEIHSALAILVKRRLALAQKIWQIKKSHSLPYLDAQREQIIIHQFDIDNPDRDEQKAVQNIFKCIVKETKTYLEAKLK